MGRMWSASVEGCLHCPVWVSHSPVHLQIGSRATTASWKAWRSLRVSCRVLAEGVRHGLGWWSSQRPLVVVSFLQVGMGHREGEAYGINPPCPACKERGPSEGGPRSCYSIVCGPRFPRCGRASEMRVAGHGWRKENQEPCTAPIPMKMGAVVQPPLSVHVAHLVAQHCLTGVSPNLDIS